jgi:succinate dehydrogenase / fumarate reductase iron-sulfur subunit
MSDTISVTIRVWRQDGPDTPGRFETHPQQITTDASFLEMLDLLNEQLNDRGEEPIVFESDCREGICGTCGVMINGRAHGPQRATATCQLHMREFADGDEIVIEPFRAAGFPIIRDLAIDRSPLDHIIESGGYYLGGLRSAPDANLTPVPR